MPIARVGGSVRAMAHWLLTVVICAAVWMAGTVVIALGARWLVHEPD